MSFECAAPARYFSNFFRRMPSVRSRSALSG